MEVEVSATKPSIIDVGRGKAAKDRVRLKKKTLQAVLEQCVRAIELLNNTGGGVDDDSDGAGIDEEKSGAGSASSPPLSPSSPASSTCGDMETDELCDLLKSGVECPSFLEKLESAQASGPQNMAEEGSSWDVVNKNDVWEGGNSDLDQGDYVLVRQEDIMEAIACFTAAYLMSLKQTKDLTPNQLQEALSKTFSVKKKKGKLRKAWEGSKVMYNVASWGTTFVGIYQNPALLRVASGAFWTSYHVISKLF